MLFHLCAEFLGAMGHAGDVVANVRDRRWVPLRGKKSVEIGHTENFRRWNLEHAAGMVQCARADPPDAVLNGMENG